MAAKITDATRRRFDRQVTRLRTELRDARGRGEPAPSEAALDDFLARKRAVLLSRLAELLGPPNWFEKYNPRAGAPLERQPAYLHAAEVAERLFERALAVVDEPSSDLDLQAVFRHLGSPGFDQDDFEEAYDFEDEDDHASPARLAIELPELVGTAQFGWTPEETSDLLVAVLDSRSHGGIRPDDEICRDIARKIWDQERRLELFSIDKVTACRFVAAHHSALPKCNTRGLMFALGAFYEGSMVAVATAGTPSGHWGPNPCPVDGILELTRIASVANLTRQDRRGRVVPVNASSALAARLIDLLPLSGRRGASGCRFITYTLAQERGTTYLSLVAKGLRPVAFVKGKKVPTGARKASDALHEMDKVVWEAGPAARPPKWNLIAPDRRQGAIRAFAQHLNQVPPAEATPTVIGRQR